MSSGMPAPESVTSSVTHGTGTPAGWRARVGRHDVVFRLDAQRAPARHRVASVHRQIDQHLLELIRDPP